MNKNLFSFLFSVFFITGCGWSNSPSAGNTTSLETVEVTKSAENGRDGATAIKPSEPKVLVLSASEKMTQSLIIRGQQAFAEERFLTPVEDNANLYFQAALGREPGNFEATQGIANIVETYTNWAWRAVLSRDYVKASRYLDSARSVNPQDPLIIEVDARIEDLKTKRKNEAIYSSKKSVEGAGQAVFNKDKYFLPKTLFSLPEEEIIKEIQPIIDEVAKTERSIAIHWPNDKEARLIYQIINSRVTEFRVRAMTLGRADYMVELQQD
ncbi:MAG: tetratricopeptide repeat protein [Marinomonas colpomeniae]